jgi:hypothetical protein
MKRYLIALLFLAAPCSAHASFEPLRWEGSTDWTFKFNLEGLMTGSGIAAGSVIDVIACRPRPGGECELRIIARRLLVVKAHPYDPPDSLSRALTLRLTPFQAVILEKAQRRGRLHWTLSQPDDRASPPVVTLKDLLGPEKK